MRQQKRCCLKKPRFYLGFLLFYGQKWHFFENKFGVKKMHFSKYFFSKIKECHELKFYWNNNILKVLSKHDKSVIILNFRVRNLNRTTKIKTGTCMEVSCIRCLRFEYKKVSN